MDVCDGTNVQGGFMHLSCTRAAEWQALPTYRVASPQLGASLQRCATSARKSSS